MGIVGSRGEEFTTTRIHWSRGIQMPFLPKSSTVDATGSPVTTGRSGIRTPDVGLAVECIGPLDHPGVVHEFITLLKKELFQDISFIRTFY